MIQLLADLIKNIINFISKLVLTLIKSLSKAGSTINKITEIHLKKQKDFNSFESRTKKRMKELSGEIV